ncbi:hypothetical protein [Streptomyces sp. NBC_01304]|uniref:hypothetical protein n=1 Tax=Streptomyces sp. NBC_01304 TaxID=2903818 RepID=UPI002E0F52E0|nr:hypothetical protein OG430_48285 [Streptomyces sp. NBC_01304]
MSYMRFQDPYGSATLRGHERPYLLGSLQGWAQDQLLEHQGHRERACVLYDLLPLDHELRSAYPGRRIGAGRWLNAYAHHLRDFFDDPLVDHHGHTIRPSTLVLNTAMAQGSDAIRLAACLHGQVELNCWVDGPQRQWLADIVGQGLADGYFRTGSGWEDLKRFLLERDDHPVVASSSHGGDFPSYWHAPTRTPDGEDLDTEDAELVWEELPARERWDLALTALRARTADRLQLTPDWADYRFEPTVSLHDLLAEDRTRRLDEAFEVTR